MATRQKAARFIAAVAISACSCVTLAATSDAPRDESPAARKPPPTRSIDHPKGATEGESRGSVSGSMTTTSEPEKEEQRGNTPPGKDRDGHGPASGAIVDPSGAATGRKPF
jgi:hypothetical protein